MLWIPHHYLPLPTNGVWVMQGSCAILSMATDLTIEEENLSLILIISDFILLLKGVWGTNPKVKFLTLLGRGTNRQANTWNGQSEWEQWLNEKPLRNTDSESHRNNTFCGVFLLNLSRFEMSRH